AAGGDPRARRRYPGASRRGRAHLQPRPRRAAGDRSRARARDGHGRARAIAALMKIAVIGGRIGGLAAARALLGAGHDAHVLEASERTGGVVGTSRIGGFVREHAASSFLGGPPRGALALCRELGVAVDKASPKAKRRWIYLDGKLRALPSNPLE